MEQLERNLAVAENYQPLSDAEKLEIYREVLPMVKPQVVRWKADDFQQPNDFKDRVRVTSCRGIMTTAPLRPNKRSARAFPAPGAFLAGYGTTSRGDKPPCYDETVVLPNITPRRGQLTIQRFRLTLPAPCCSPRAPSPSPQLQFQLAQLRAWE